MSSVKSYQISQYKQAAQLWESVDVQDSVIGEEPLEVWVQTLALKPAQASVVGPQPLIVLMRTPGDDINLVTGWLLSSGIIDSPGQIKAIHHSGVNRLKQGSSNRVLVSLSGHTDTDFSALNRQEYANSACGVCGQQSIDTILLRLEQKRFGKAPPGSLLRVQDMGLLVAELSEILPLFRQTGGNHGVALFAQHTGILDIREDVGRHNALDKLIGANAKRLFASEQQGDTSPLASNMGVILSGRVGFEMIQKAVMANLTYVLALGAPSSLAIDLARDADIALVGFIKAQGFNVYCGQHLLAFST